jgi:hypothetical protein
MKSIILIIITCFLFSVNAQNKMEEKLPYHEIPEHEVEYTAGTVVARMVDGLGFRYYWATEGLRAEDLAFKPSDEARTTNETIDHIYRLTKVIYNSAIKEPNNRTAKDEDLTFEEKRKRTLVMLEKAANIFRAATDLKEHTIIFLREENSSEFPFWNQINGPIEDAVWHCGQVISFRRSSGNPYNSNASLFTGKLRE